MKKARETPPILTWLRLPGRLSRREFGAVTGFYDEDAVSFLAMHHMAHPLGDPPPGAPMWFAAEEALECASNRRWLDKASRLVREHTKGKNAKKAA